MPDHDCFEDLFGDIPKGQLGVLAYDGERYVAIKAPKAALGDKRWGGDYMDHLVRGFFDVYTDKS